MKEIYTFYRELPQEILTREYASEINDVNVRVYHKENIISIKIAGKWSKAFDRDNLGAEVYHKDTYLVVAPCYDRPPDTYTAQIFQKFSAIWNINDINAQNWSKLTHIGVLYGKNKTKAYWVSYQDWEIGD